MMKISDLVEQLIELKIEGAPEDSAYVSIDQNAENRRFYEARVQYVKGEIDKVLEETK